jgi:hypothetical protein
MSETATQTLQLLRQMVTESLPHFFESHERRSFVGMDTALVQAYIKSAQSDIQQSPQRTISVWVQSLEERNIVDMF